MLGSNGRSVNYDGVHLWNSSQDTKLHSPMFSMNPRQTRVVFRAKLVFLREKFQQRKRRVRSGNPRTIASIACSTKPLFAYAYALGQDVWSMKFCE